MDVPAPTDPVAAPSPASSSEKATAPPPVWALAGGKGGAGRTLLVANLGIQLARGGLRVTVVDLDLRGGNLHASFGFTRASHGLGDFAGDPKARLADLGIDTSISHLRLISGAQRLPSVAGTADLVERVAAQIREIPADHVIVDCGSGRGPSTLTAFGMADLGILVSTPEPSAIEATGLFAETHLRRCVDRALPEDTRRALEDLLRADGADARDLPFRAFMTRLGALDSAARDAVSVVVRRTRLELLLNMVRDEEDEDAGAALAASFRACFGISLPMAGLVSHDPSVLQAIQKRRPLSQQFPNTLATQGIARAASRLLAALAAPVPDGAEEWVDFNEVSHYRVLDVAPKASPREVQSAYQILKRAFDPETTHLAPLLDTEGLRVIQARVEEAYRSLIFLESRVAYDRHLVEAGSLRGDQVRGLQDPVGTDEAGAPEGTAHRPRPVRHAAPEPPAASDASPDTLAPGPPLPQGSGRLLRAERLRLGLSLESIAGRTKIRQTYLHAIEEDRYAALPPPVFLRGFVREFAACLGLPADDTARAFLALRQKATEPPEAPGASTAGSGT